MAYQTQEMLAMVQTLWEALQRNPKLFFLVGIRSNGLLTFRKRSVDLFNPVSLKTIPGSLFQCYLILLFVSFRPFLLNFIFYILLYTVTSYNIDLLNSSLATQPSRVCKVNCTEVWLIFVLLWVYFLLTGRTSQQTTFITPAKIFGIT